MSLTDSDTLKFLRGSPVFLDDICAVYPATLGEIIDLGYDKFQTYLSAITANKPTLKLNEDDQIKQLLNDLTDFQYILMMTAIDKDSNEILREAFHFFCREDVSFSLDPAQIIIGPIEEKHLLTEDKFYELQRILRRMYFLEQDGEEIIINDDDDPTVKKLKLQMRANREKVRIAKAKKAAREKSDLQFSDLIGSITVNNCGLNIKNIWDITYYAFHDQLKRMGWRDQYDINNKAALAGAKLKKSQLKHWMRSISDSDKS